MQGIRYQGGDQVAGPWEYGALAAAGKRRGLDEAVDSVKAGVPLHEVAAEYSLVWYRTARIDILSPDARQMPIAAPSALMGRRCGSSGASSGTGKSRWVAATWPDAFWKAPESKWWGWLLGQETVVLTTSRTTRCPW